jgi:DNA polymerase III subunit delta
MVFFFYGPNTYAARNKIRRLVDQYRHKAGSDFGLERLDGASVSANDMASALMAMPFLANSRLVIIENLAANKTVSAKIEKLLPQVPGSTIAVFYDPAVDQRTSYFKTMSKLAKPAKFEKLNPAQLRAWIKQEVARLGAEIDQPALDLLLEIVGDDQWRLEQELIKLANANSKISVQYVRGLVVAGTSQTIFDLVDQIVSGQLRPALMTYRQLINERTNELYILTMIVWQLRNLLLAKTAGAITGPELAKKAGMSPYVASKVLARRHDFNEDTLKKAYLSAIATEYAIKSGQGESEVLIEQLIFRVANR